VFNHTDAPGRPICDGCLLLLLLWGGKDKATHPLEAFRQVGLHRVWVLGLPQDFEQLLIR
jgi:hypothetical protein